MQLNGYRCECCDEYTFQFDIDSEECIRWERQGCTVELSRDELQSLLYGIQRALQGKTEVAADDIRTGE